MSIYKKLPVPAFRLRLCPNNGPGFRPLLVTAHPLRSLALSALCSFLFPIWFLLQRFFTRFLALLAPFCLDRTAQCLQSFRQFSKSFCQHTHMPPIKFRPTVWTIHVIIRYSKPDSFSPQRFPEWLKGNHILILSIARIIASKASSQPLA